MTFDIWQLSASSVTLLNVTSKCSLHETSRFSRFEDSIGVSFSDKASQQNIHTVHLNEKTPRRLSHNERRFSATRCSSLLRQNIFETSTGRAGDHVSCSMNTITLSETTQSMNINEFSPSRGETARHRQGKAIYSCEHIRGICRALYLDKRYAVVKRLYRYCSRRRRKLVAGCEGRFQEKAQEVLSITPAYKVLKEMGPDHDKRS